MPTETAGLIRQSLNDDGVPIVDPSSKRGKQGSTSTTICSHDFGDRTSWYQNSVAVVDEVATDSGDGLTFNSANANWVNIHSSTIIYGHKDIPKGDGTYGAHADWEVEVKVDDVVQTSGYTVDFPAGDVTFDSSQSGNTVKVSYHHNDGVANPSSWVLTPQSGKKLIIEHVEVQFSKNTTFNGDLVFEAWAGAGSFATYKPYIDALYDAGYGQQRVTYRNFSDLINHSNLGTGEIPAIGHLTNPTIVFPFNYIKSIVIDDLYKSLVRISISNDTAVSAGLATITFYCEEI